MDCFCNRIPKFLFLTSLLFLFSLDTYAQSKQRISFPTLLKQLEIKHAVSFSYNYSLMENLRVNVIDTSLNLEKSLGKIKEQTPFLSFEFSGNGNVLVIPLKQTLYLKVVDKTDKEPLFGFFIKHAANQLSYIENTVGESITIENTFLTDSILFQANGYKTTTLSVQDILYQNNIILLESVKALLDEVEITSYITTGITANLVDHSIETNMNKLGLLAGETGGDIFQLIKALPGIQSPNGKPGSFNLRGNVFDQNLIYFDNIPVYHTGHYFGTFSPYNPNAVETISIYRNSLPTQWGGRSGGLIDIKTEKIVVDSLSIGAFVNTVFGGGHAKIPLIKDKLSLSIALRSDLGISSPKLEEYSILNFQGSRIDLNRLDEDHILDKNEVRFNDQNAKLIYSINDKHQVSVSLLRIYNSSEHRFLSIRQNGSDENLSVLNNWGSSAQWDGRFNEKLSISSSLSVSDLNIEETRIESTINTGEELDFDFTQNEISDLKFNTTATYAFNSNTEFKTGYEVQKHTIHFLSFARSTSNPPPDKDNGKEALINSVHASVKRLFGSKWISQLGIRMDHYSLEDKWFADPRFSLTYNPVSSIYLKASAGRSHQYIKQYLGFDFDDFRVANQFWLLADENTPVLESDKAMIGSVITLGDWLFDLELYAQNTSGISRQDGMNPIEVGELNTLGADVLIKKSWKNFRSWISYSIAQTEVNFNESDRAYFDQTHVFSFNASVPLKRFNVSTSWSYMSGLPINVNQTSVPYSTNFPDQHQLDISATYSFLKSQSRFKGIVGVSLINVYDQELIVNQFYNDPSSNGNLRMGLGFTPGVQLSFSWN